MTDQHGGVICPANYSALCMPYSDVFLNCEQDYSGYEPLIGLYR